MRIYVNNVVLAGLLVVPSSAFQIVMMSNYLNSLGGGGNVGKEPWSPDPKPNIPDQSIPAAPSPPEADTSQMGTPPEQPSPPDADEPFVPLRLT